LQDGIDKITLGKISINRQYAADLRQPIRSGYNSLSIVINNALSILEFRPSGAWGLYGFQVIGGLLVKIDGRNARYLQPFLVLAFSATVEISHTRRMLSAFPQIGRVKT